MDDAASNRPGSPRRDFHFLLSYSTRWREFRETLAALLAPAPVRIARAHRPPIGNPRAQAYSVALHAGLILLLLSIPVLQDSSPTNKDGKGQSRPVILWDDWKGKPSPDPASGGGGSGNRNPIPPTRGALPPMAWIQPTPPTVTLYPDAALQVPATLVGPPELQLPNIVASNFGDPKQLEFTGSSGPGEGGASGDGKGRGTGPGDGDGYGPGKDWGAGRGVPRAGQLGTTYPVCAYCPDPQFTEEARKAKHQGVVRLAVIVGEDGRTEAVRVVQGLGMGLDERAVEAVRGWKFRPAVGADRRPAKTWIIVEVVFRLL